MGLALTVGYETINIGAPAEAGPPPGEPLLWSDEPRPVPVPGAMPLPESDWVLEASILERWDMTEITAPDHPWIAYFDAEALARPVRLRTRRPGDRFSPHGMEGHSVKVSELMINLKIPEAWRDYVPLLVAGGEVVWVCGRRIAEGVTVEPETRKVTRFRFERTSQ
jgi:tRNA(Ile)-lysidine synthase